MSSITYEKIGSLLYHNWKNTDNPVQKKEQWDFIQTYLRAPLFIVGFKDEDIDRFKFDKSDYDMFKLPFRSVLLDLPNASRSVDYHHEIPAILYVSDLGQDAYYCAVLIDRRKVADLLDRSYCAHLGIDYDEAYPQVKSTPACLVYISFVARLFPDEEKIFIQKNTNVYKQCDVQREEILQGINKADSFGVCKTCGEVNDACKEAGKIALLFFDIIVKSVGYINEPSHYVIRETVGLSRRETRYLQKSVKPFFLKKPAHIVLDHSQTKELIRSSQSSLSANSYTVMPHQRRGHWRYLKADIYKVKRQVWVRPADINVGLQWNAIGNRTYEVIR